MIEDLLISSGYTCFTSMILINIFVQFTTLSTLLKAWLLQVCHSYSFYRMASWFVTNQQKYKILTNNVHTYTITAKAYLSVVMESIPVWQ